MKVYRFATLESTRSKHETWRRDYIQRRPHGSFDHVTPKEFIHLPQAKWNADRGAASPG